VKVGLALSNGLKWFTLPGFGSLPIAWNSEENCTFGELPKSRLILTSVLGFVCRFHIRCYFWVFVLPLLSNRHQEPPLKITCIQASLSANMSPMPLVLSFLAKFNPKANCSHLLWLGNKCYIILFQPAKSKLLRHLIALIPQKMYWFFKLMISFFVTLPLSHA
jgi:hypothetical protein